jgi:transcription elongation factor Elf1
MQSYGSKICCLFCGTAHIVRVGEVKTMRQIEFVCSHCGKTVIVAPEAGDTVGPQPGKPDSLIKFEMKIVE